MGGLEKGRLRGVTKRIPSGINLNLYYTLCLLFFILSLMSKPMAITLPAVLLILDIYPLGRLNLKSGFKSLRGALIEKIPFFVLSLASSVVTILAQKAGGAMSTLESIPLWVRIWLCIRALGFYLFKMLWPTDLYPLYPYPANISFLTIEYMGALILLVCITGFCIWSWKRHKVFSALWAYYVVTLLPVLGIIQVGSQAAADRYTYLPSLGPFLLVGLGIALLYEKIGVKCYGLIKRNLFIAILLIPIFSLLSILTLKQIMIWKDSLTLNNYEINKFQDYKVYTFRGKAYAHIGNYQRAINNFNRSAELNPKYELTYNERGVAYKKSGRYQEAIEDFNRAINLGLNSAKIYYNRGVAYTKINNFTKAIKDYDKAIEMDPNYAYAYSNRGSAYKELGNYQEALGNYNLAIKFDPLDTITYYNRGMLYIKLGNYQQAIKDLQAAARLGDKQAQDYLRSKGIAW